MKINISSSVFVPTVLFCSFCLEHFKFAAKSFLPDILLLENTLEQFLFLFSRLTLSFFDSNVKYLPCLTTEGNLKPDKSYFIYSQTIFSFGGNFSKLPTVLRAWVRQRAIILCFGPKFGPKQGIIAR